jgi:transposase
MKVMMIGCDLHDKSMLVKTAIDAKEQIGTRSFSNDPPGRHELVVWLRERAEREGVERIVLAYEASGQGFGLCDLLTDHGIECYVLAPTKMAVTPASRHRKTDERDALKILEVLKGYVLAGNSLPSVCVPDRTLRDDRDLLRTRGDLVQKLTTVRTQVRTLLKRHDVRSPEGLGCGWTKAFELWLSWLAGAGPHPLQPQRRDECSPLGPGARAALVSLLRQLEFLEEELSRVMAAIRKLAASARYAPLVRELTALEGVGLVTAMVFLTELGDPRRFRNRRQVAAYFGLAPSSYESGTQDDRKGHITRQGSPRVRQVLCQAAWVRVQKHPGDRHWYERIKLKNPKKKKVAVVALMRRLSVLMWHRSLEAAQRTSTAA